MTETDISDISNLLHDLATSGTITMSKADDFIWLLKMRIALMEIEFGEQDADRASPARPSWQFYRPVPGVNPETPV
ncbi:MAG: hypothetical protein WCJ93_11415 [Methanomicrobiales archaeon]